MLSAAGICYRNRPVVVKRHSRVSKLSVFGISSFGIDQLSALNGRRMRASPLERILDMRSRRQCHLTPEHGLPEAIG